MVQAFTCRWSSLFEGVRSDNFNHSLIIYFCGFCPTRGKKRQNSFYSHRLWLLVESLFFTRQRSQKMWGPRVWRNKVKNGKWSQRVLSATRYWDRNNLNRGSNYFSLHPFILFIIATGFSEFLVIMLQRLSAESWWIAIM